MPTPWSRKKHWKNARQTENGRGSVNPHRRLVRARALELGVTEGRLKKAIRRKKAEL